MRLTEGVMGAGVSWPHEVAFLFAPKAGYSRVESRLNKYPDTGQLGR